jgi:chorismate mutase
MGRDGSGGGRETRLERRLGIVRGKIDRLDGRIIALLARRRSAVVEVGRIKRLLGFPVEDPRREEEIVSRIHGSGLEGAAKSYVGAVYRAIFRCSYAVEREE